MHMPARYTSQQFCMLYDRLCCVDLAGTLPCIALLPTHPPAGSAHVTSVDVSAGACAASALRTRRAAISAGPRPPTGSTPVRVGCRRTLARTGARTYHALNNVNDRCRIPAAFPLSQTAPLVSHDAPCGAPRTQPANST